MKMFYLSAFLILLAVVAIVVTTGCASRNEPLKTPSAVDLKRFMGTWYVIGYTPLGVDKEAHNGIEHYYLAENGDIETTYQFRKGSFEGELKTLTPVGRVHDHETNAEWRMQFIWPFKAQYVIMHVDDRYQQTIIAHPNRKYAWIMARTPQISSPDYEKMMARLESAGFDRASIRKLPQDWSRESDRLRRVREAGKNARLSVE